MYVYKNIFPQDAFLLYQSLKNKFVKSNYFRNFNCFALIKNVFSFPNGTQANYIRVTEWIRTKLNAITFLSFLEGLISKIRTNKYFKRHIKYFEVGSSKKVSMLINNLLSYICICLYTPMVVTILKFIWILVIFIDDRPHVNFTAWLEEEKIILKCRNSPFLLEMHLRPFIPSFCVLFEHIQNGKVSSPLSVRTTFF